MQKPVDTITAEQHAQIARQRMADVQETQIPRWIAMDCQGGEWFWVSFANDSGFLGAVILKAPTPMAIAAVAHLTGCNPGGQSVHLPISERIVRLIPSKWIWRLLSREECDAFDREMFALNAPDAKTI